MAGCKNAVIVCCVFLIVVGVFVVLGGVTIASYRGNDKLLLPSIIAIVVGVVLIGVSCGVCNFVKNQNENARRDADQKTAESQPLITRTSNKRTQQLGGASVNSFQQLYTEEQQPSP